MATTSPDNLRTPNPSDPYNLVPDLQTLASDTQTALNRRANSYIGTNAEMQATAAPNGAQWFNTTDNSNYVRMGGAWVGGGWVALSSLITPTAAFSTSLSNLFLRRSGDSIELQGFILNTNSYTTWEILSATPLPPLFRPNQSAILGAAANNPVTRVLEIAPTGHIRAYSSGASSAWWSFTGARYYA